MTNEDAIEYIECGAVPNCTCASNKRNGGNCPGEDAVLEALDIAVKALEKQIPKKPINHKDGFECKHFDCPCCQSYIVSVVDGELCAGRKKEYCDRCGQAIDWRIDWSDEE